MNATSRKHPRVDIQLGTAVYTDEGALDCQIEDISLGGMRIRSDKPLECEDGAMASFAFTLASGKTTNLLAEGKLTYSTATPDGSHLTGFRFLALTAQEREALVQYIAEHSRPE